MKDLTAAQFAAHHNLCPQVIRFYCRKGRIPSAYRAGGTGQWLIPRDAPIIRKRIGSGRPRKDAGSCLICKQPATLLEGADFVICRHCVETRSQIAINDIAEEDPGEMVISFKSDKEVPPIG